MTISTTDVCLDQVGKAAQFRDSHLGWWRLLTALPSATGSVLLLVLVLGWIGQWEVAAIAAWFICSGLTLTRVGERAAVAVLLRFRRPTAAEAATLDTVWAAALNRAELSTTNVELYVQRSSEPNAYATGRRSVAVTRGLLREFAARRLSEDQMQALLLHELGHHATRATTGALTAAWLALPWRLVSRLAVGLTVAVGRRTQSLRLLMVVVVAGVVVAVVQAVHQQHWTAAIVLCTVSLCTVVSPIGVAVLGRRNEYAADRYADALGYGPHLASALKTLGNDQGQRLSLTARTLNSHPSTSRRVLALDGSLQRESTMGRTGSDVGQR